MCGTEKVVDGLDRIECGGGNHYKYGVPVAHGAVPEAGKLKGAEVAAIEGLF